MNQKEEEESKCREFVDELNCLAEHDRYRYIGHVSELEGKEFPDCLCSRIAEPALKSALNAHVSRPIG